MNIHEYLQHVKEKIEHNLSKSDLQIVKEVGRVFLANNIQYIHEVGAAPINDRISGLAQDREKSVH